MPDNVSEARSLADLFDLMGQNWSKSGVPSGDPPENSQRYGGFWGFRFMGRQSQSFISNDRIFHEINQAFWDIPMTSWKSPWLDNNPWVPTHLETGLQMSVSQRFRGHGWGRWHCNWMLLLNTSQLVHISSICQPITDQPVESSVAASLLIVFFPEIAMK